MSMIERTVLKQIVREVIGPVASTILLDRIYKVLDEENKDLAAQKQTCRKIEKMVSLFIGPDAAGVLEKRFKEVFT